MARQPTLLRHWDSERVISRRRLWAARLVIGFIILSGLGSGPAATTAAGVAGWLVGYAAGAAVLFAVAYRLLSRPATDEVR